MIESLAPDAILHVVFNSKFIKCVWLQIVHHRFCNWAKLKNPFLFFILFSVANRVEPAQQKQGFFLFFFFHRKKLTAIIFISNY